MQGDPAVKPEFRNESQNATFLPADARQSETQMPLGAGFDTESPGDVIIDQPEKKKLSSSTLLLLLVVALAGIGLYSMRSLATAKAGGSADKNLEETIESFLSSITGGSNGTQVGDLVVDDAGAVLLDDRIGRQVPLDEVQKNPFVPLPMEQSSIAEAPIDDGSDAAQVRIAQARQAAIEEFNTEAAKLRVLMVMGGSEPMANVSGRVVRVGDTIADERLTVQFKVIEISQGLVVIRGERADLNVVHDIALRLIRD
jgi:hypothetical protein